MKKILAFIVFIVSAVCAYSQNGSTVGTPTDAQANIDRQNQQKSMTLMVNDDYQNTPEWGKYKALRTVGWTTFGVGIAATTTGALLLFASNSDLGSDAMPTASKALMISGGVITIASIPIISIAYHNRNKAKKIGINMGVTQLSAPIIGQNIAYTPAMNFTITF
ncbi:MAG: hypothetical protein K2O30_10020 [Duncaniella sp.]|nr:hypothetical protein [Duncaniella sp.]MDE7146466.1 hypothetical protein [Duncaniella sp.]